MKRTKGSLKDQKTQHRKIRKSWGRSGCMVYGLHNGNGEIVYIGQTKCTLPVRMKFHRKASLARTSDLYVWWRAQTAAGRSVEAVILDKKAIWDFTEVVLIERHRASGKPLLNMTGGGTCTKVIWRASADASR